MKGQNKHGHLQISTAANKPSTAARKIRSALLQENGMCSPPPTRGAQREQNGVWGITRTQRAIPQPAKSSHKFLQNRCFQSKPSNLYI